jgi:Tfp pilus assembly protein PilN
MSKTSVTTRGKPKDNMGRLPWMLMLLGVISGQCGSAEGFTAYDCSNRSNIVESNLLLEPDACTVSDGNGEIETVV